MPAAVIVMMAMRQLKRGRARSHGKEVEVAAVDDLQALLPAGWSQRRGLMTSRGDVDLWLATDGWCGRRASYRDAPYAHPGRAPWFEA